MRFYKVSMPPASEPVTVSYVKLYTRIPHAVEDALVTSWINAARKAAEEFQHRSYITQVYKLVYDCYPENVIEFPMPPLVSVDSVKYYGIDDTEYDFSSSNYLVDTLSEIGRLALNYSTYWPTVTLRPINSVIITFTAGYGNADDVPENVKEAICLYCANRYENRASEEDKIPKAFYDILRSDRVPIY